MSWIHRTRPTDRGTCHHRNRMVTRFFVALFSLLAGLAGAAPYTPASDDQVLAELTPAEQALGQPDRADNEADAIRKARTYVDYARQQEDARFLGYALATLSPWSDSSSPPTVLLMAEIELRQHQFDNARARLQSLLSKRPEQGQGWLMLANLERVQGRFDDATHACRRGTGTLSPVTVVICQGSIQAVTGKLPQAWQTLNRLAEQGLAAPGNEQRWLYTLLAEMAIQKGLPNQAQRHIDMARLVAPDDPYLTYLQSDVWLKQGHNDKVITRLQHWQERENALLRLSIAGQRSGHPDASQWQQAYQKRIAAARQSGRDIHLREQARFQLEVTGQYLAALANARANWDQQRELPDLRLLLASARTNSDPESLQLATDFIQRHEIHDATLQQLQENQP